MKIKIPNIGFTAGSEFYDNEKNEKFVVTDVTYSLPYDLIVVYFKPIKVYYWEDEDNEYSLPLDLFLTCYHQLLN